MKFVKEFRDPALAKILTEDIHRMAKGKKVFRIMEVCGGHTHTIYRHGLRDLLPENIELVHGPGCPVCVLPIGRMDDAIAIAQRDNVILTCFGDLMRVPGTKGSLMELKAQGADIRMVYSPLDALRIARENPEKEVVFFAIGFETTSPSTTLTLQRAKSEGIRNFFVFCNHILIAPPLRSLLESELNLDAFIGPGHVSAIVGCEIYKFIPEEFGKSVVISGFEPLDLLQSIWMVIKQLTEGRCEVENQYTRVVKWEGNLRAQQSMKEVFEVRPFFEWRGLGIIPESAVRLSPAYAEFDAEIRYQIDASSMPDPGLAQCGEVIRGNLKPGDCKAFGKECTPERPLGALMVSSEGACSAYYQYGYMGREELKVL